LIQAQRQHLPLL
jgi:NTP pyrophosphatase (non-canonical NTP hydrolase)